MIITCPTCRTQYTVPENAIKPGGKRVKCSSCANVWLQKPLEEIVEQELLDKLEDSKRTFEQEAANDTPSNTKSSYVSDEIKTHKKVHLPAVREEVKTSVPLRIAAVAAFMFALCISMVTFHNKIPQLQSFYDTLGMKKTEGLAFKDFVAVKQFDEEGYNFSLTGKIINESTETRHVPNIVAKIYSTTGQEMATLSLEPPIRELEPGNMVDLSPTISNVSEYAASVTLDIGNSWELFFR